MNKKVIDLNCDLGESYGNAGPHLDQRIMPYISSCNIACGFHSGDPLTISKTIDAAMAHQLLLGAHPSYPDLQGFGRRYMEIQKSELRAILHYQISALRGMIRVKNAKLYHVKPHGALYNAAAKQDHIAEVIIDTIIEIDDNLVLYGLSGSRIADIAISKGLAFRHEVFADRLYEDDLQLRHRKYDGAVLNHAAALKQVEQIMADQSVTTISGTVRKITADTICLHSDTPDAIQLSRDIYELVRK